MDKSHVGIGFNVCPVCGQNHSEAVLFHTRLRPTLTKHEFLGWAMCPEHQKLAHEGYVALIEVNNQPNDFHDADRTGNIAHVRSSVWTRIFNSPVPDKGIAFVEVGVFERMQTRVEDRYILDNAEVNGH